MKKMLMVAVSIVCFCVSAYADRHLGSIPGTMTQAGVKETYRVEYFDIYEKDAGGFYIVNEYGNKFTIFCNETWSAFRGGYAIYNYVKGNTYYDVYFTYKDFQRLR